MLLKAVPTVVDIYLDRPRGYSQNQRRGKSFCWQTSARAMPLYSMSFSEKPNPAESCP